MLPVHKLDMLCKTTILIAQKLTYTKKLLVKVQLFSSTQKHSMEKLDKFSWAKGRRGSRPDQHRHRHRHRHQISTIVMFFGGQECYIK